MKDLKKSIHHIKKSKKYFEKGNQGMGVFHARQALRMAERPMEKRCWEGYEPTPNKKPYEKGSCQPIKKDEKPLPDQHKPTEKIIETSKVKSPELEKAKADYEFKVKDIKDENLRNQVVNHLRSERLAAESKPSGTLEDTHPTGRNTLIGQAMRREKLKQRQEMKAPDLGKARVDEGKTTQQKRSAREERNSRASMSGYNQHLSTHGVPKNFERGVHTVRADTPNRPKLRGHQGNSSAGDVYRDSVIDRNTYNHGKRLAERSSFVPDESLDQTAKMKRNIAIASHKKVLEDLKRMPKPNLPKSDMYYDDEQLDKAKVDESLSWSEKRKARRERSEGSVKGIHRSPTSPYFESHGESVAGNALRSIPKSPNYPHGIYGIGTKESMKRDAVNRAKEQHQKVLNELRAMPKPNLPKSDMYYDDEQLDKGMGVKKADAFKQSLPKAPQAPKVQAKPVAQPKMQSIKPPVPKAPKGV